MDEQPDSGLKAKMGAEAIRDLLAEIDLEELSAELRAQAKIETSVQRKKELLKRLRIVEAFRQSEQPPRVDDPRVSSRCCRRTCARWCRSRAAGSPPRT